jgi:exodeoxyribonuclease VII large subunit
MNHPYPSTTPSENTADIEVENVFSVAQYIQTLNSVLRPYAATIQGEISAVTDRPNSRAVFFTICDKSGTAAINCVVWRNRLHSLGFDLKMGMEVKVRGYAEIYPQYGKLSFMTEYITPLGEGQLKLAFEKLKRELEQAGYFRQEIKQPLPPFIQSIGLITSDTAAAKKDFLTHLGNHGFKILFHDVRVEGISAVENIVDAIRWFNENAQDVQVLVITRGGGSLESLQAFNTLEVTKAIYSSKIPVLTAIGHEQDVTIADLVADVRASVPTHAGKLLAEPWERAAEKIDAIEGSITYLFRNKLQDLDSRLTHYQDNYISCFGKHLSQCKRDLDRYQSSMMRCFKGMLTKIKEIETNFSYNHERFERKHRVVKEIITNYDKQLIPLATTWQNRLKIRVTQQEKLLQSSDPQLKLKQGFSIVKDKSGNILRTSKMVQVNDILSVQFFEGSADAKVKSTH